MFPDDADVQAVPDAMFDPFEYLVLRDKDGLLQDATSTAPLGKVSYHIPCHSRVQNVGQKTREVLEWIPGTDGQHGRALRRARRHLRREERVLRDVDEDRPAGVPPDGRRPSPTSSAPTARSPGRHIAAGHRGGGRQRAGRARSIRSRCCAWPTDCDRSPHPEYAPRGAFRDRNRLDRRHPRNGT